MEPFIAPVVSAKDPKSPTNPPDVAPKVEPKAPITAPVTSAKVEAESPMTPPPVV